VSELDLLIDLHLRNDRQGPGGDSETERAVELAGLPGCLPGRVPLQILDVGCGTGASSLSLARALDARVTAVDAAAPFVDRLRERAAAEGLADRVRAEVGRMESLAFEDERFDVVWSEGAVYHMGFAEGARAWRRLLRPGGVIAISELTWTTAERPADIEAHWTAAYPGIATASGNLRRLEAAGYAPAGFFFLPDACWEENYYAPLRAGVPAFLERHGRSDAVRRLVAAEEAEMALYRDRGAWYGYAFYIARKTVGATVGGE